MTGGVNVYLYGCVSLFPPVCTVCLCVCTPQKMKLSIKDFFLWIWSHLLKKSLMENFIFLCSAGSAKEFSTMTSEASKPF